MQVEPPSDNATQVPPQGNATRFPAARADSLPSIGGGEPDLAKVAGAFHTSSRFRRKDAHPSRRNTAERPMQIDRFSDRCGHRAIARVTYKAPCRKAAEIPPASDRATGHGAKGQSRAEQLRPSAET